jgi:CrcB protein
VTGMYWLTVAMGGAVGAMGRAGIAAMLTTAGGFPWQTFAANTIGSLAIGVVWAALVKAEAPPLWSAFLITGVLGGFTTFSTFSLETVQLFEQGAWQTALGYIALSVLSCVLGAGLGVWVVRALG